MIEYIIDLLAPHCCVGCDSEGSLLCCDCGSRLVAAPGLYLPCDGNCPHPAIVTQKVFCATLYTGDAKAVVRQLKFGRAKAAASDMARIMAERLPRLPVETVVTHIPTDPARVRQRGYDQAALLAAKLTSELRLTRTSLLHRNNSVRQTGKGRADRLQQARNLFSTRPGPMPKHILLVDDVLTTGATLRAAVHELHAAGTKHVAAAVFAAAERFG
jgi:ComF family protein